jgi:hypothetical protein
VAAGTYVVTLVVENVPLIVQHPPNLIFHHGFELWAHGSVRGAAVDKGVLVSTRRVLRHRVLGLVRRALRYVGPVVDPISQSLPYFYFSKINTLDCEGTVN